MPISLHSYVSCLSAYRAFRAGNDSQRINRVLLQIDKKYVVVGNKPSALSSEKLDRHIGCNCRQSGCGRGKQTLTAYAVSHLVQQTPEARLVSTRPVDGNK